MTKLKVIFVSTEIKFSFSINNKVLLKYFLLLIFHQENNKEYQKNLK